MCIRDSHQGLLQPAGLGQHLLSGVDDAVLQAQEQIEVPQAKVRVQNHGLGALAGKGDPKDMQAIVALLERQFDYVLIDCPAGIEDGFKNAAAAAREAVVITTPEVAAVRDADRVIGLLNTQGVQPVQLVLNRVRPKMMSNQEMLSVDDVTDILALPLLGLVCLLYTSPSPRDRTRSRMPSSA